MLTILERINQIKGVKGSSIVSPDGIEIVSHVRTPVPSDFISALIVSVQQVANKIVANAQAGLQSAVTAWHFACVCSVPRSNCAREGPR